jgi:hypothetical protein
MMLVSGGRNSPGGLQRRYRPWRRSGHWVIFPNCLVSRRLTFCFLHSGRCRIAGTVGCW